ncbi:hypothetical protein KPH14_012895 [Odynerus spinipes]|uniref:Reverse transcriptase n=1 Tax=Odynerus spinipes TaxID=1348599 RepID=A0AAD9RDD4_9HYME|nr:hypothetical protein KPH14_012895 [Odynerus spinipes]
MTLFLAPKGDGEIPTHVPTPPPRGVVGLPPRRHLNTAGSTIKRKYNLRRGPRPAGPAALAPPIPDPTPRRICTPRAEQQPQDAPDPVLPFPCPNCERAFTTKSGLGLHRRRAHEAIFNDEISVDRVKRQWSAEELRMMAREEALATQRGVRFINQHLLTVVPDRTLDSIKGARRGPEYKRLVAAITEDLAVASSDSSFESAVGSPLSPPSPSYDPRVSSVLSPLRSPSSGGFAVLGFADVIRQFSATVRSISGWETDTLSQIAMDFLSGAEVGGRIARWIASVFPSTEPRPRPPGERRVVNPNKKQRRRAEYARIQRLFRSQMSRAVREILDGQTNDVRAPDVRTMAQHWGPFVAASSRPAPAMAIRSPRPDLKFVWSPISCEEVVASNLPLNTASGIDGITARLWRAVPPTIKALLFNVVLASGGFPSAMLASRTVFIPKGSSPSSPAEFRPISITSVVVRHLHKVLAQRLRESGVIDLRQRCFDDGCAECVSVLAAAIMESRSRLRELHVAALDFAKAYDTISHGAIASILRSLGMPRGLVDYIERLYANSSTTFEVRGERSELFRLGRGVRQGDPLSPILFCLVADTVMRGIPSDVGFQLGAHRINSIAYADDVLLFSASKWGLQTSLGLVESRAEEMGLRLNAGKCSVLSFVPSGKEKKIKIISTPTFRLQDGSLLPQIGTTSEWRYLGVDFQPAGPKKVGSDLSIYLDRLTRAPLKPQQRLKILRCFLIPRLYHALILGRVTLGKLNALDLQTRAAVRRWLRLPHDVPNGFMHAPITSGGLGIPAMSTSVPGLLYDRLNSLGHSTSPQVRGSLESLWVAQRLQWAKKALTRDGACLSTKYRRDKWWTQRLHAAVDGFELRECSKSSLSSWWIDGGCHAIPGRDYVQHVHVRINALPSRMRTTTRGRDRTLHATRCRAGCNSTETAAHIIQGCFRTHGGRVQRHNAVGRIVAAGLRKRGWTVHEEPVYITAEGKRKPDLVCVRDTEVHVVDTQVVSGVAPLVDTHQKKVEYYSKNQSLVSHSARGLHVGEHCIKFSSCTISWRGIWCSKSADWLLGMGLTKGLLRGITTRVLQGSHTNWSRWNRITSVGPAVTRCAERQGVG